mmetsp:Transcript_46683/g.110678  ORF Transcript_46683/g.110678 Transcript_46683/m.110678 type:complete len:770 (+) Transcript_46683:1114-3423(+)
MHPERGRRFLRERRVDVLQDVLGVARVGRRLEPREDLEPFQQLVVHVRRQVVGHQPAIVVVRDMSAVHDLAENVPQVVPGHLRVGLEVVHRDLRAAREVAEVEGVDPVPALRPELLALDDHGVEQTERKRDALELARLRAALEEVVRERQPVLAHVRPEPLGRLVGQLHAHLQDVDRQLRRLSRQEHPELRMRSVQVVAPLLQVPRRPSRGQVDVLQERPPTVLERHLDRLLSHRLLPLSERHQAEVPLIEPDTVLLAELLRVLDGVHAGGEDEEDGGLGRDVAVRALEVEGLRRDVLGAHDGLDKGRERLAHAVGAERADEQQALELGHLLPVARQRLLLGALELEPLAEALGGADHVVGQLLEDLELLERVAHEPRRVVQPLRQRVVHARRLRAADQKVEHLGLQVAAARLHLEAQLARKHQLVPLEQALRHVAEAGVARRVDEHVDPRCEVLCLDRRRLRWRRRRVLLLLPAPAFSLLPLGAVCHVHALLEDGHEVGHREAVHVVQHPELVDEEVGQRAADGDRNVRLARGGDGQLRLLGDLLLLLNLVRRHLGALQPLDELDVLEDVALRGAESVQQLVLQRLELELEPVLLLHEHHLLFLEIRALLVDHQPQQLLLEPVERDHEVDDRGLRRDLRLVVRVAQLRLHEELEVGVVLDLLVAELDHERAPAADDGAHEHGVQHRVDVLADVLDHDRLAVGDRHLDRVQVLGLCQLHHLHLLGRRFLGVGHKRPGLLLVVVVRLRLVHLQRVLAPNPLDALQLRVDE